MPTGYTAAIADGIDFNTYAWSCARAMGALTMMRDEPTDAPIPERFEPSDYHIKKISEARATLAKLEAMTPEEAVTQAKAAFDEEVRRREDGIAKADSLRRKYEAMLVQVRKWKPPTQDHEAFKRFMAEQIQTSIEFDCGTDFYERMAPRLMNPMEWLAKEQTKAMKDIGYHAAEHEKEVQRANERSAWVAKLRESLKP